MAFVFLRVIALLGMTISRPIHAANGILSFFCMVSQHLLTLTSWRQFVASSRKFWHPDTVAVASWPRRATYSPEPHLFILTGRRWYWRLREEKGSACQTGDAGSIPGSRRSPGGGNGNPLQYSCLENPMDRGAWRATVHGIAKSWAWLSN